MLDGHLRHLPGGIDEYLRMTAAARCRSVPGLPSPSTRERLCQGGVTNVEKEIAALDRALVKLSGRVNAKHVELAEHDQSDHVGLARLTRELWGWRPTWPTRRAAGCS